MKVAVCVSGVPRSGIGANQETNRDFKRNFKNLQTNFPGADFFVGTWREHEAEMKKDFPDHQCLVFDEPDAHYHPYLDMPLEHMVSDKMRKFAGIYKERTDLHERTRHQAKQILCHANMVDSLPMKYDVIVRARFDTFTYANANFSKYLDAVYNDKVAIGFACLKPHWPTFNKTVELTGNNDNFKQYLFDSLIIHHGNNIDTKNIFDLFNNQKLCPAEFGWYQTLSMPYNDNHRCVSGWVNADRCVLGQFLVTK